MRVLRGARFLLALGLRLDRGRLIRAVIFMLAGYAAAPFMAVALGRFTDNAIAHHFGTMLWLAVIIPVLLIAQLVAQHFAHLDYYEIAEKQETRLRAELINLVNRPPGIEHLDDPEFADGLVLVRESLFSNTQALEAVLQLAGLIVQTVITAAILFLLSPWLVFLPLMVVPPALFARKAQNVFEQAREDVAEQFRLNRHLMELSTSAASVKELRIFGAGREMLARQNTTWQAITAGMWRGQAIGAAWRAAGQLVFAVGYCGAIVLLVQQAVDGRASLGDLILVITLTVQVSTQIAGALQLITVLQSAGQTVQRINELRAMSPEVGTSDRAAARRLPARFEQGISFEHVRFQYPGIAEPTLQDFCLDIPAGHTLALVGENGSGKSTLVKLLTAMYGPTSGRILIDGNDLMDFDPVDWRTCISTLFQDFYRFNFTLGEDIGLGEVRRLGDRVALSTAVERAHAEQVVRAVPGGLNGFAGRGYEDGTDLSGGQWQLVGLARCLMRDHPQLLILDEPAAALDAGAEHALFERYASSATAAARERGGITVLVSHRFSTVLMADTIAVLDQGHVVEHGSHGALMKRNGLYAELFRLQARAYR